MANQLVGNVYIVDSQMGVGIPLLGTGSISWPQQAKIANVSFWTSGTDGKFDLVFDANTTTTVFSFGGTSVPAPVGGETESIYVGGINFDELQVRTLTAGTGFIYLL